MNKFNYIKITIYKLFKEKIVTIISYNYIIIIIINMYYNKIIKKNNNNKLSSDYQNSINNYINIY